MTIELAQLWVYFSKISICVSYCAFLCSKAVVFFYFILEIVLKPFKYVIVFQA